MYYYIKNILAKTHIKNEMFYFPLEKSDFSFIFWGGGGEKNFIKTYIFKNKLIFITCFIRVIIGS